MLIRLGPSFYMQCTMSANPAAHLALHTKALAMQGLYVRPAWELLDAGRNQV